MTSLRERAARFLFGGVIDGAIEASSKVADKRLVGMATEMHALEAQLASISAEVREGNNVGWAGLNDRPGDRDYAERYADLLDARVAWRKNFFVRRIVNLIHSYVVGDGVTFTSDNPEVESFAKVFWKHRKNHMKTRLTPICDQLTRDGEVYPILFTNKYDGMSYVRFKTAVQIRDIETLKNDWEEERVYHEGIVGMDGGKRWYSATNPRVLRKSRSGGLSPVMLHWVVNRPLDALHGEGDLTPVLPWARRYSEWLKDRVRLNRQRTRQGMMDVEIADDSMVEGKRSQLDRTNPISAGIYVHGSGEKVTYPNLAINASDVESDGRALRQAVATGSNLAMHYLGEGEGVNYATAKEMGEPTARFYTERQQTFIWHLGELIEVAYARFHLHKHDALLPDDFDYGLKAIVPEVARADNEALAKAALSIAQALAIAAAHGWTDDETALTMMMKFAGETLSKEDIERILGQAKLDAMDDKEVEVDDAV